jgi:thiamine-phosphate pyrophosphorylase
MAPLDLPPLYAILDPEQTKSSDLLSALNQLLEGGATVVQLRAKIMEPRDFFELAHQARALAHGRGCRLIVNDRVDVALGCGADGVHLGQDDVPLDPARKLMAEKIIGISTHSVEQALAAERGGADYIGFGPMFGTATKDTGYGARGIDMLRAVRAAVKIPIVAIGGIKEANIAQVWQGGADSAAIISDILGADDIAAKVRRILRLSQARPRQ